VVWPEDVGKVDVVERRSVDDDVSDWVDSVLDDTRDCVELASEADSVALVSLDDSWVVVVPTEEDWSVVEPVEKVSD
jgi:hypothetical protein